MSGHKTTHTQMARYKIIDSLLADGSSVSFSRILLTLRNELRDKQLSESSVRRDIRYMRDELLAPLVYDDKTRGWKYKKAYRLPMEHFSDEETLYLYLIKKLLAQHSPEDSIYKGIFSLLEKISPVDFPDGGSSSGTSIYERFFIPSRKKCRVEAECAAKILNALKNNRMISFYYCSKWEPEENFRRILPYQIVLDEGSLYLYGAPAKQKEKPRLFNLAKIYNLEVHSSLTFTLPKNFRFHEEFEKGRFGAFQYDECYRFKIAFFGPARRAVHEYVWADDQVFEEDNKQNKTTITFTSSQWIPIQQWLLSFGEDALPLEPDWFVQEWKETVRKMAFNAKLGIFPDENPLQKE